MRVLTTALLLATAAAELVVLDSGAARATIDTALGARPEWMGVLLAVPL